MSEWFNVLFRWLHVIAGVMWIGHLWFFNFVNAQLAKTYDADSKKKVVPELMPRALYWFRWGAAYTWVTGLLLLFLVIYHGGALTDSGDTDWARIGIALVLLVVGFAVYDQLWKALATNESVGGMISFALIVATAFLMRGPIGFSGRATFIHVGAIFGTIMAANVWMRIWPAQRKIINAVKTGGTVDPSWVGTAGLRSKHNTYMSMPLMFTMVSNHYPNLYGADAAMLAVWTAGFVAVGWGLTKFFYNKSASAAPGSF